MTNAAKPCPVSETEKPSFAAYLATAHVLAERASAVILPHFRAGTAVHHKGGAVFDPVTAADRDAEAAIRSMLAEAYPTHGIVGEEFGDDRADAEHCWIIDPIDGTRAFLLGQPLWGTLIGLTKNGAPLLGMMNQPYTNERFWSGESESFFCRGEEPRIIRTRPCGGLAEAALASTTPDMFDGADAERYANLAQAVRMRRFGGDCYNYCLLAAGQIDLVVEAGLKPFDILPLVPIIERAGGVVTTWDDGDPRDGGRIVAAGDPAAHAAALDILSS
jgi:histidinol phosphatase-like enzyme (inositol monophosphatase family)